MKKAILGIGGLVAALTASTANAAVVFAFGDGLSATATLTPLGLTLFNDFDSSSGVNGVQGVDFDYKVPPSDTSGAVIPTSGTSGTPYLSVLGGGVAEILLPNSGAFGFDWGSLDSYNKLTAYGFGGEFGTGGSVDFIPGFGFGAPANGNQVLPDTNGVFAVFGAGGEQFTKLVLTSRSNSFEIDNLMTFKGPVPEPSTWAMMIVGLGMVGYAMRSRQRTKVSFA